MQRRPKIIHYSNQFRRIRFNITRVFILGLGVLSYRNVFLHPIKPSPVHYAYTHCYTLLCGWYFVLCSVFKKKYSIRAPYNVSEPNLFGGFCVFFFFFYCRLCSLCFFACSNYIHCAVSVRCILFSKRIKILKGAII